MPVLNKRNSTTKILVIGGGSFATAIVKILCEKNCKVSWWMRDPKKVQYIKDFKHNPKYLSSIEIDTKKCRATLKLNPAILGINCRDLKTMKTNLTWFKECLNKIKIDCIKIAESGIKNKEDLQYINNIGYDGALVGTRFMKSGNPGNALADMLGRIPQ